MTWRRADGVKGRRRCVGGRGAPVRAYANDARHAVQDGLAVRHFGLVDGGRGGGDACAGLQVDAWRLAVDAVHDVFEREGNGHRRLADLPKARHAATVLLNKGRAAVELCPGRRVAGVGVARARRRGGDRRARRRSPAGGDKRARLGDRLVQGWRRDDVVGVGPVEDHDEIDDDWHQKVHGRERQRTAHVRWRVERLARVDRRHRRRHRRRAASRGDAATRSPQWHVLLGRGASLPKVRGARGAPLSLLCSSHSSAALSLSLSLWCLCGDSCE